MAKSQSRSRKKVTGSRYVNFRKKKSYELGRDPTYTKIDEPKRRTIKILGGKSKTILLSTNEVNLYNPTNKKYKKAKLKTVKESPANRDFIRRNIITKGTIIETDAGLAKISNRPGQEAVINAVLIKKA